MAAHASANDPAADPMSKKTHDAPHARVTWSSRKRPTVHILRYDEATESLKARPALIPEDPKNEGEYQFYCLLVNGNGDVVVDAGTGKPVYLECPPVVLEFVDRHDRLMSRSEIANRTGLSVSTIKRLENAGELPKTKVSSRRVGVESGVVDEWMAKQVLKRRT